MIIDELILALHQKHLAALNMFRFVDRDVFRLAYAAANDVQKEIVLAIIATGDIAQVEEWTKRSMIKNKILTGLDYRSLRTLASQQGVRNYSRLSKKELIDELERTAKESE